MRNIYLMLSIFSIYNIIPILLQVASLKKGTSTKKSLLLET